MSTIVEMAKSLESLNKALNERRSDLGKYYDEMEELHNHIEDIVVQFVVDNVGKTTWEYKQLNEDEFDLLSNSTVREFFPPDVADALEALRPKAWSVDILEGKLPMDVGLAIENDRLCLTPWLSLYEIGGDISVVKESIPWLTIDFGEHEKAMAAIPPVIRSRDRIINMVEDVLGDCPDYIMDALDNLIATVRKEEKNGK